MWYFMDFKLNFCDRVLHNFSVNYTKKYCRPLPVTPTKASLLNGLYEWNLTGCKPRLSLWYQTWNTIYMPFGLVTQETQFFHRSPQKLAKEKYPLAIKLNSLGWPKQASVLLIKQLKNIRYRHQRSQWIRTEILYNIICESGLLYKRKQCVN
jgi:hypothetical protein